MQILADTSVHTWLKSFSAKIGLNIGHLEVVSPEQVLKSMLVTITVCQVYLVILRLERQVQCFTLCKVICVTLSRSYLGTVNQEEALEIENFKSLE